MFDLLAGRYDLLNTILSGGSDERWRRAAAAAAGLRPGGLALDVACGSGRLALALERASAGARVIALDFSSGMLQVAARRAPGPAYVRGDGLSLPFADEAFDAVTVAFGLRNYAQPEVGLREMLRVLRPGGLAVVLEFVQPRPGLAGRAYRFYLRQGLPRIGGLVSGQPRAYRYLSETVDAYRRPEELVGMAAAAEWREPRIRLLTLGTVGLLTGRR
ncbi:MAG: ubiquinone/menaquinone biosynthesis methyltransferase [Candidatus Dormibacteraeota bacterium]|nr:ubiquinone/menaquinone biosynthesis methyltransferase [Candidatus Dormibacteraeota bacterium]